MLAIGAGACGDGTAPPDPPELPGSLELAYVASTPDESTIRVINGDGSGVRVLGPPARSCSTPAWSPDGQRLAYSCDDRIFTMDADGANRVAWTEGGPFGGQFRHAHWSPDGNFLVLESYSLGTSVAVLDVRTGDTTLWSRDPMTVGLAMGPRWTPDGRIAVSAPLDGNRNIWIADMDGTGLTRLSDTPEHEIEFEWSPAGDRVVATVIPESSDTTAQVWVMAADGTERYRLAADLTTPRRPTWSPDGQRIALINGLEASQVWVVDVATGETRRVTTPPGSYAAPDWSPDGNWIAYQGGEDGRDLWVAPAEGGTPVPITPPDAIHERDVAWRPLR